MKAHIHLIVFVSFLLSLLASDAVQASDTKSAPAEPPRSDAKVTLTTMSDARRIAKGATLGELSFQPERECKKPPKAPPDRLLRKRYSTKLMASLAVQSADLERHIHHIDLNGDGICDWLREGAEPNRYDLIEIDPRDFLFLGTRYGWRYPGLTEEQRRRLEGAGNASQSRNKNSVYKPPKAAYAGFFTTPAAFVFEKNNRKPFLVEYFMDHDRFSVVSIDRYQTYRWNDKLDNFEPVPVELHAAILLFLQKEFCGKESANITQLYSFSRVSYPGYDDDTLCRTERPDHKK